MNDATANDFQGVRAQVRGLQPARSPERRSVLWIDPSQTLGVARDPEGRVEIFITGDPLSPSSELIAGNLAHNAWRRIAAPDVIANRILLPAAPHFDSVAALICSELVDNGFEHSSAQAFRRSEPIIELAIQRLSLQGQAIVGLFGELLVLRALLDRTQHRGIRAVLDTWHGHVHSARDLQLASVGLEVKTTRGKTSTHKVQGIRQVEIGHGIAGVHETSFFLLSLGLDEVSDGASGDSGWSLPELVDDLLERIDSSDEPHAPELRDRLLEQIRVYGASPGEGYDHEEMRDRALFSRRWRPAFVRAYDMTDPLVLVPRTADLGPFTMIDPTSVEFELALPPKVNGDLNPIAGMNKVIEHLTHLAWGSEDSP